MVPAAILDLAHWRKMPAILEGPGAKSGLNGP